MKRIEISPKWIHGAVSIESTPSGLKPHRLPHEQKWLFDENVFERAECGAGVRLRFCFSGSELALELDPREVERSYDLVSESGEILETQVLPAHETRVVFSRFLTSSKPSGGGIYEIWLCHRTPNTIVSLSVEDGAEIKPEPDTRRKWLTYGSSISQCGEADSPARTWPATAARTLGLNLLCMGFSGQCHMDGMVAKVIRDQPADLISLKIGINIYGASSLGPRSYKNALINMVDTIREQHQNTPIAVITAIISPGRENEKNLVDFTLKEMRRENEKVVALFQTQGDEQIGCFSGLELFDEADLSMLPDDLHPNSAGYELMGKRFAEVLYPQIAKSMVIAQPI